MRLTPRAPTLEGLKALWHCGPVALWRCKDLWHCGTVVRTPCRCIGVYVDGFPRIACEFTQHSQVSCDRGSGRQNRQKVSRLGVLGALWQSKIIKKCQKDTAFSSKIISVRRLSKLAYSKRKCTSLKRNVRI